MKTQQTYRQWLQANNIDSYAYAVWLRKEYPGRHWIDVNTPEARERYLEITAPGQKENER